MSDAIVVLTGHAFEARAMAAVGRGIGRDAWGRWMLYRGEIWDHPFAVIRTGPGKAAAAAAAQAAIQYLDPALVMSFGVAGCSDPSIDLGTLVVADRVIDVALAQLSDHPAAFELGWDSDDALVGCFAAIPGTRVLPVVCWEGHNVSPIHRPPVEIGSSGPLVVDWESAAVAHVCATWDVPWGALKVVSDHGEADRLRRLAVVARRPLQWAAEVLRRGCHVWLTQGHEQSAERDG